jgi:hypothetical protein
LQANPEQDYNVLPLFTQLNLGTTAVYKKFDSIDEATVIASQKDHRFGDFVGFPYASQWYLGGLGLDESLELFVIQTKEIVARGRHHAGDGSERSLGGISRCSLFTSGEGLDGR